MLVHHRVTPSIKFANTHLNTGGERFWETKASCPRTQHNVPGSIRRRAHLQRGLCASTIKLLCYSQTIEKCKHSKKCNVTIPWQLFLSLFNMNPEWHSHLKLPSVLTHTCWQSWLRALHSSRSKRKREFKQIHFVKCGLQTKEMIFTRWATFCNSGHYYFHLQKWIFRFSLWCF